MSVEQIIKRFGDLLNDEELFAQFSQSIYDAFPDYKIKFRISKAREERLKVKLDHQKKKLRFHYHIV